MNYNKLKYVLAMLQIDGIGISLGRKLLNIFPDPMLLFSESMQSLRALGITEKIIAQIKNPNWINAEKTLLWAEQPNHHLLYLEDALYPALLKETARFPIILFVDGNVDILNSPQLAMVGSRKPTPLGLENAFAFAKQLASMGITITSGLAMGIDGASHEGALAANGSTIAVLGTGIDQVYPKKHVSLARRIIDNGGTLISEFLLGTEVKAENFPQRNRLISGLSLGTLVVEATLQSGSLITAHYAVEQNREIFAMPGSIHNTLSRGCNHIIKQGAKLVETVDDVFEELLILAKKINYTIIKKEKLTECSKLDFKDPVESLDLSYKKLLDCIDFETTPIDVIIVRSGLCAEEVASMLLILELKDFIASVIGGYIKIPCTKNKHETT